jgi:hypothetical protein
MGGQPMSDVPCQNGGMRNKKSYKVILAPDEIIGHFGRVQLVKTADGSHRLVGGTMEQRAAVRKWCERFAIFVVFSEPSSLEISFVA